MPHPIVLVPAGLPPTSTGWSIDAWTGIGQNWDVDWVAGNVEPNGTGGVSLTINTTTPDSDHTYGGAQLRATETFLDAAGHTLTTTIRTDPAHPSGAVLGAFTFPTVPWSAPGTEVTFEWTGRGLQAVVHQYPGSAGGGGRRTTFDSIELGFDPSAGFHTYETSLITGPRGPGTGTVVFVVDGEVVAHMDEADVALPFAAAGRSVAYLDYWPARGDWAGVFDPASLPTTAEVGGSDFRVGVLATPDLQNGTAGADAQTGDTSRDQLFGNGGDDTLRGRGNRDRVMGEGGNDTLHGGIGNDIIVGGSDSDLIYGGTGRNVLWGDNVSGTGNPGADRFAFASTREVNSSIGDFGRGADRLDLSALDANSRVAGNQAFGWGGAWDSADAHRVGVRQVGANTLVYLDSGGDGRTDAGLVLRNTSATTVTADDFIL